MNLDRGTPLRCRNLCAAIQRRGGIEARLHTDNESLRAVVQEFEPDYVYGVTHNALRELTTLGNADWKRIIELHGDMASELLESDERPVASRAKYIRQRLSDWWYLRHVDGIVVVSPTLCSKLPHGRPHTVVWGGVDVERMTATREDTSSQTQAHRNGLLVAYIGNFRPYQGVEYLFEACRYLREEQFDLRLRLVGDSTGMESAGAEHWVDVVGKVPYEEVPNELRRADVLVVPRPESLTAHFGFPSKLAEYMAAGKAIVATDIGMHSELIQHMQTGLLVEPNSVIDLARAIRTLEDEDLREELGYRARQFAESHLTWDGLAKQTLDFMESI